jgi:hypothetical protein
VTGLTHAPHQVKKATSSSLGRKIDSEFEVCFETSPELGIGLFKFLILAEGSIFLYKYGSEQLVSDLTQHFLENYV